MVPSLVVKGDVALLSYAVYQPEGQSADQISDSAIAVAVNVLRALCGSGWHPIEVFLPRRFPPILSLSGVTSRLPFGSITRLLRSSCRSKIYKCGSAAPIPY